MAGGAGGGDGYGEVEVASVVEAAFDGDLAALRLDEAADECEAHAGTGGASAGETVEDGREAFGLNAASVVDDKELDAIAELGGFEADFASTGSVAECVLNEIVEDSAQSAAVGRDVGEILVSLDVDADVFGLSLAAMAGGGILEGVVGADFFRTQLVAAGVEFGDFHEVNHDVVEFFGFEFAAVGDVHLQVIEVAGVASGEGVEREAEVLERLLEALGGDVEEAGFEAVDFGEGGHVFEDGDCAEEAAVSVSHGGGAEAVAVFGLADAHGEDCGFAFSRRHLLHGDGAADGGEDAIAAGRISEGVTVFCGFTEDFFSGAIELEDVALGICNNDGFEDGLNDRVRELLFHLTAAAFSFAEVSEPDGEAVDFGGDGAEVVAGAPFDAMLKVAAADLSC